jgi:hypothetical protein
MVMTLGLIVHMAVMNGVPPGPETGIQRSMRFRATDVRSARTWQRAVRGKLYELMMGGGRPTPCPLQPQVLQRIEPPNAPYVLEELTIQSLPDRRAHLWVASPRQMGARRPAILAIHGHGGTGEQIVRGQSLYWYGRALAEMGYVVIAPDVGQHTLQHPSWSLMGERTWDCIRAVDYAARRPDVDVKRMGVCGLSLGGETTMYVAALDERLKVVDSSGWLTTVENMRNGHCTCYDFPGLAEHFDFADIFGCIAPRPLVCEIGARESAPGGFPLSIARPAFAEIRTVYRLFGAEDAVRLSEHPGGHVFVGFDFWPIVRERLGRPWPFASARGAADECARRAEIAARCFGRAICVLEGWLKTRDSQYSLLPRTLTEPVWAPNDNAADLMPFLFITDHLTGAGHMPELLTILQTERQLTNRQGPLPDWFSLKTGGWVHEKPDLTRLIFGAAEYCKDGLMPMTEIMGRGPWTDRTIELLDAVIEAAPVATDFGRIPAADTEVNGDMLQVLGRVYAMTGHQRYLDQLVRLADAYCLEVIPRNGGIPAHRWDFSAHRPTADTFNLNDHGNEIVLGLAEAFIAAKTAMPDRVERWRPSLTLMFRRLLDQCRNSDGLWVGQVTASSAAVQNPATPDTWGYALAGLVAFADATGDAGLFDEAKAMLRALSVPRYATWQGADSYADAIEGAILLRNRTESPEIDDWLDRVLPVFLACQRDDGIVEGWYGDGNYARTALMVALRHTEGTYCRPWKPGLHLGAVRTRSGLRLLLHSDKPWTGKLHFDTPRHRTVLHLSSDYPRLNKWPEWFTVESEAQYRISGIKPRSAVMTGKELAAGIPIRLDAAEALTVEIEPLQPAVGNKAQQHASKTSRRAGPDL